MRRFVRRSQWRTTSTGTGTCRSGSTRWLPPGRTTCVPAPALDGRHRGGRLRRRRGLHGVVDRALPAGGRPCAAGRRPRGGDRRLRCERTQRRLVLGTLPRLGGGARAPARPGAAVALRRAMNATVAEVGRTVGGGGHRRELARRAARWCSPAHRSAGTGPRRGRRGRGLRRRRRPGPAGRRRGAARVGADGVLGATYTPHCARVHPGAAGARARAGRRAQRRGDPRADPRCWPCTPAEAGTPATGHGAGPARRAGHRGVDGGSAGPPPVGRARLLAHGRDRAAAGPLLGPCAAWPRARRSPTTGTW